ncbi:hypothetical protein ACE193_21740 [Bernardetia sp. OM2101]|uniref:hypothetical protein n=1 Tax=Bernardetia sp. OM2101 TaxID=3344876 RepID=UPI0035CF8B57
MANKNDISEMYSRKSGLVIGFHGCDESIRDAVLNGKADLRASENEYDWLGSGIYFWENNYDRALQYAKDLKKFSKQAVRPIEKPSVIGAILDLGFCMDLMDSTYLEILSASYKELEAFQRKFNFTLPKNRTIGKGMDLLLRNLDCTVIEATHKFREESNSNPFDSVRGVFFEGKDLYPNAGFKEKNHIQIAIRNPNCIKGYFLPKEPNNLYTIP